MLFLNEYIDEKEKSMIDHGINYQNIEESSESFTEAGLMDNVSVIIRCNNEERWIGHTIQSCLDLIEFPEIIIVDNNSSDNSIQIARLFNHDQD